MNSSNGSHLKAEREKGSGSSIVGYPFGSIIDRMEKFVWGIVPLTHIACSSKHAWTPPSCRWAFICRGVNCISLHEIIFNLLSWKSWNNGTSEAATAKAACDKLLKKASEISRYIGNGSLRSENNGTMEHTYLRLLLSLYLRDWNKEHKFINVSTILFSLKMCWHISFDALRCKQSMRF